MPTSTGAPFRADHVGSLLRPAWLHAARAGRAAGKISAGELRDVEDRAVREAVELQRSVGLRSVTDGEFRRATWHMDFVYQIGGIAKAPGNLVSTFHNEGGDIEFTPDAIRVQRRVSMGGYDFVADALFNSLDVDGFFLEYDDERSGGFEPLRFVPKGKRIVLGLVTAKRPRLESPDDLKRRIEEASKYVPLDQLCLSGQCGFASTAEGNALTVDDQKAKLELIVRVADEIWG